MREGFLNKMNILRGLMDNCWNINYDPIIADSSRYDKVAKVFLFIFFNDGSNFLIFNGVDETSTLEQPKIIGNTRRKPYTSPRLIIFHLYHFPLNQ
jgi:hypothetical protein